MAVFVPVPPKRLVSEMVEANGSKPKRLFKFACAVAFRERPLGPSVWDQSKPVPLLAVLLMLRTLTWMEIWCFGRSMVLRKVEILRIALSLSITTMVLTFGSNVTDARSDVRK